MNIKPEMKTETEVGLEVAVLDNKLSFDAAIYKNDVKDQIIAQSLAPSMGASSVLANLGLLTSKRFLS